MHEQDSLSLRCLRLAQEDPARALVLLWVHLRDQGSLEPGLHRDRCALQAEEAFEALVRPSEPPAVHPMAAFRFVDDRLDLE